MSSLSVTMRILGSSFGFLKQEPHIRLALGRELNLRHQRAVHYVRRVLGIDGLRPFGRQQLVERPLVFGAGLAVHADQERLVAERQHLSRGSVRDERPATFSITVGRGEGRCVGRPRESSTWFSSSMSGHALGPPAAELEEIPCPKPLGRHGHLARPMVCRMGSVVSSSMDSRNRSTCRIGPARPRCRRS